MAEETPIKALRLKKYLLKPLLEFLEYPLAPDKGGRTRAKFVKRISEFQMEADKERIAKLVELCEKDETDGKPIMEETMIMQNGRPRAQRNYKLSAENQKAFDEFNSKLWDEEAVIDILPSTEAPVNFVKNFILKYDKEIPTLSQEQAFVEICEAFEKI